MGIKRIVSMALAISLLPFTNNYVYAEGDSGEDTTARRGAVIPVSVEGAGNVTTAEELVTKWQSGSDVTLANDIDFTDSSVNSYQFAGTSEDGDIIVDLNGYTLTMSNFDFVSTINQKIILKNGTVKSGTATAVLEVKAGTVEIENVVFDGNTTVAYMMENAVSLSMNGVTVRNSTGNALNFNNGSTADIQNAVFTGNANSTINAGSTSTITVNNAEFTNNAIALNAYENAAVTFSNTDVSGSTGDNALQAYNSASLTINHVNFTGNKRAVNFESNKELKISDSVFENNQIDANGAAVNINSGANAEISNSTFKGNSSKDGGAIKCDNSTLTIKDSEFTSNVSSTSGGAVNIYNTTLTVSGGSFTENSASGNGGAIAVWGGDTSVLTLENTPVFTKNTSGNDGGAIYTTNTELTVNNGTFTDNTAAYQGGAVAIENGTTVIYDGTFTGNTAAHQGGAVAIENGTTVIYDGTFTGNAANDTGWANGGGAIRINGTEADATILKGTFDSNFAEGSGGAVNFRGRYLVLGSEEGDTKDLTVTNNISREHEGGGIAIITGISVLYSGYFSGNKAGYNQDGTAFADFGDWGGGAIFVSDQSVSSINDTDNSRGATLYLPTTVSIYENTAGGFGGGVAGCSTGRVALFGSDTTGITIFDNTAEMLHVSGSASAKSEDHEFGIQNATFMAEGADDYFCALSSALSNHMLGGYANWTGSVDGEPYAITGDGMVNSGSIAGLNSNINDTDKVKDTKVVITGNTSYTHGGGILNNGFLVAGSSEDIKDFDIEKPLEIQATKSLINTNNDLTNNLTNALVDNEFKFTLKDEKEKVVTEGKANASGLITFEKRLVFSSENCAEKTTFTYYLQETVDENNVNFDYDTTKYKVTFTVTPETSEKILDTTGTVSLKVTKYVISDVKVYEVSDQGETEYAYDKSYLDDESHKAVIYLGTDPDTNEGSFVNTARKSISVTKVFDDADNQDGIREDVTAENFELYQNGTKIDSTAVVVKNNDGTFTITYNGLTVAYTDEFGEQQLYTYSVKEVNTAEGYKAVYPENKDAAEDGDTITNEHTPETISVSGTKTWVDADDQDGVRPSSITVNLYADGTKVDSAVVKADANGVWSYSFENLSKYSNGNEITYTVTEETVDGYTAAYNGYNITNTHTPETIAVSGTKTWNDNNNQDGVRPDSITVNLLADGTKVGSTTVTEADNWSYSFTDLPKYRNQGIAINYTVAEESVNGYTAEADGYDITNTHTPETIEVSGAKTWNDNNNQDGVRPSSITINLYADGTKVDSAVVKADNNGVWSYSFKDLPKYSDGKEITYTVTEETVDGYTAVYNGYNITNTHTPATVAVSGTKTWDDNNNQDGKRPSSITVNLYADGKFNTSTTVKADENGEWSYSFTDLPKYDNGKEITYTVDEKAVDGYTSSVDGYNIKNAHIPETVAVSGTKVWDDNNNQDGVRPSSITVNLLANGTKVKSAVVTAADNWTYSFTDLPKYSNGQEITYSVTEDAVSGYTTKVNGTTITNSYEPSKISVTVTKAWDDNNDQDGKRPGSISVQLYADGTASGDPVTLSDANQWTYTWSVDEYNAGNEIAYTVAETDVPAGYTAAVTGDAKTGYTITNTHTPEKTVVDVKKIWADNNDQDGKRPSSITVNLLADGEVVEYAVITANTDWYYAFTDIDMYADGKEIVYTVEEAEVPEGYSASIIYGEMVEITNTYEPETVTVSGTKTWDDADDQDGIRPSVITVNLYADGELYESTEVSERDQWTYNFTDLPKYRDHGLEINYTVEEETVEGYTSTVDGYDITNEHTPETVMVSGTKTWVDENDKDKLRPKSITVNVLADGEVYESFKVTAEDQWAFSIEVPKYNAGREVVYTVTEDEVEGYTTAVDGYNITNTHTVKKSTPDTSDHSHTAGYAAGLGLSGIAAVILLVLRRKTSKGF